METEHHSQPFLPNGNGSQPQSVPVIYAAQPYESDEDELNLGQVFAAIRRRALLITGVTIAVTSAALIWALTRTPQYEGKFELLVEPVTEENKLSNLPSLAQEAAGLLGEGEIASPGLDYETQIAVLKSPKMMFPIIEQLQAQYPDIRYDSLIGQGGGKLAGQGENKLNIARQEETKIIEVSYQDPDPQKIQFILDQVAANYLKYSIQDRRTNLRQGLQFVEDQIPRVRSRVNLLGGQLQRFQQQHNIINPEIQAQQMAEQVSNLKQQRLENRAELNQTRSLSTSLQKQLGLKPNEAVAASALSEDTQYQALLSQLQEVEAKIATESARFTEADPTIQNLRDQQRNLLGPLKQESQRVLGKSLSSTIKNPQALASQNSVRLELTQQLADASNQVQALEARGRAIAQAESLLNRQVNQFPALSRQHTGLQRDLMVTTEALNQLLAKREALRVENAQQDVPWEIIAAPTVLQDEEGRPVPVSPVIPLYAGLGMILGLLLGGATALILELLSAVFHTPEAIKETTKLPLLGEIPLYQDEEQLPLVSSDEQEPMIDWHHDFAFSEAFHSLSTNIRNLSPQNRLIHSLVISSAMPGEGKSTVAVHLAHVAAEIGQRVLLVDTNLRNPQIHTWLGLSNHCGLTNVIAATSSRHAAIQQSPTISNLFVLTAGEVRSNPAALLASEEMQSLMEQFQAEFDLVVYDTSSILGFTDSTLLMPRVDGVILVVKIGQTSSSRFTQALERAKTTHTQVLGFVANGVAQNASIYQPNTQFQQAPKSETKSAKLLSKAAKLLK
jgi:capsular exopolysaccharide synthesis family protein